MTASELKVGADTAWTILTAFLVFFMNAGFGLIEAGLCRRKNATMILSKNFVVFAISTLGFFTIGFGLMFSRSFRLRGRGETGGASLGPSRGRAQHLALVSLRRRRGHVAHADDGATDPLG
jgi:ammonium transporter, Amt family